MTSKLDAVVFDLDGTLIHSAPDLANAVNQLLAEENCPPITVEDATFMIGDGVAKLVERAFAAGGNPVDADALPPLTQRFLGFYEGHETDRTRPFPGVPETLAALTGAGLRLAVCTNKPQAASEAILRDLGLAEWIAAVVGGDSVVAADGSPIRKPDGRHVLAAVERIGADAGRTALVGDSPNDIDAGRAAGLSPILAVRYGYRGASRAAPEDLDADVLVDVFPQILPFLAPDS